MTQIKTMFGDISLALVTYLCRQRGIKYVSLYVYLRLNYTELISADKLHFLFFNLLLFYSYLTLDQYCFKRHYNVDRCMFARDRRQEIAYRKSRYYEEKKEAVLV